MKVLALLVLSLFVHAALADEPGPFDDKCNKDAALEKIERAVVNEIRREIDAKDKSYTYGFNFSPVWRGEKRSDLTVYFEKVWDSASKRRGYVAQYSINQKTCAPTLIKFQAMYTDTEDSAGLQTASPTPEPCNDAKVLSQLHAKIIAFYQELYPKINPGELVDNFTFSGVLRAKGASDMAVFFDRVRPGLLTTPMVGQVSVDLQTCTPRMESSTDSTWLLIKY